MLAPTRLRRLSSALVVLLLAGPATAQTNLTWDGSSDVWSNTSHWSPNQLPNGNFNAIINSGTVTLDGTNAIVGLTLGGTLTGAQTLTTSGLVNFNGTINGSTLQANGGVTLGSSSTFLTSATLNHGNGQTFTHASAGTLFLGAGSVLNNAGLFAAQSNTGISANGGSNTFNNTGTFTRSVGSGNYTIGIAFNNTGGQVNSRSMVAAETPSRTLAPSRATRVPGLSPSA